MRTVQGLAPMAIGAAPTKPSGTYSVFAPEAPVGSILRVTTRDHSTRYVQKVSDLMFLDVTGSVVTFVDWEFATRAEAEGFLREQRIESYADLASTLGAPALSVALRCLPRKERDDSLCDVADVLRARGYDGKASQVLTFRCEADE